MPDLKNATQSSDPRLDRVYELDWNSLNFLVTERRLSVDEPRAPRSYTYFLDRWLNQFNEGACVGFGYCHDAAAKPVPIPGIENLYARWLYWMIQRQDPWPGGEYPGAQPLMGGTSVLTGAKVMTDLGYYVGYDWALNALEVAESLGYDGPVILGLDWMTGMFDTDENGFIHATGAVEGGHCICAVAVKIVWKSWISRLFSRKWDNVDLDKSYITLHNSWGSSWGANGRAKLSLRDLQILMDAQGEACCPRRQYTTRSLVPITAEG